MRNSIIFLVTLFLCGLSSAQTAIDTSVCDVLAKPGDFDGKIVRLKATVSAGFDEFLVKGAGCGLPVNALWLSYPEGTKAKAGPVAMLRLQTAKNGTASQLPKSQPAIKLQKNKDFNLFDSRLAAPAKVKGVCPGCVRYTVNATLVGRIDVVKGEPIVRDGTGRISAINGFGNINSYPVRLVLQSVADVVPQEVDYARNPAALKDDSGNSGGGDPVAAAHQAARAFQPGSIQAEDLEAAAAAYGKEGEDNGVQVGFGPSNEIPADEGSKGTQSSPDGILYFSTFDMDRLKGAALSEAISHVGSEIAALRSKKASVDLQSLEATAWQVTVLSAVARGQKTLTAPGGYLLWNTSWPESERGKQAKDALTSYLHDWSALGK